MDHEYLSTSDPEEAGLLIGQGTVTSLKQGGLEGFQLVAAYYFAMGQEAAQNGFKTGDSSDEALAFFRGAIRAFEPEILS